MAKPLIEYALYLRGWKYEGGDEATLERDAEKVYALDFDAVMANHIFCPNCFTPITRRPLERERTRNNKRAFFAHIPSYLNVPCERRTPYIQGELFNNEEVAREAIARGDLVVFSGFAEEPQVANERALPYAQGHVEDPEGPETRVPIARHVGDEFYVPGRNRTIMSICRNFDQNLQKYYQFPGQNFPSKLMDQIRDVFEIAGEDDEKKLYFGEVKRVSFRVNQDDILLKSGPYIKDFTLVCHIQQLQRRGFNRDTEGVFVLFWGQVFDYGLGFCVRPRWGEYAMIPPQYNDHIRRLRAERAQALKMERKK
ncbi:hypothetical protein ACCQ08_21785 [Comamonas sp. SY3]|uniref:hypothetical protein n=1 Tax=Comamonas sp. SY3 TaxID=3243601 RepID=UPI0035930485